MLPKPRRAALRSQNARHARRIRQWNSSCMHVVPTQGRSLATSKFFEESAFARVVTSKSAVIMQSFRFCSLPQTYQVGSVFLLPHNNSARRLRPCCVCQKVSLTSYKCVAEHNFCPDCFISPGLNRKWCVICKAQVNFDVENFRIEAVEEMEFACACNFVGPLSLIREHLLTTETPRICYQQPGRADHPSRPLADLGLIEQFLEQQGKIITKLVESCCHMRVICDVLSGDQQIFCFRFEGLGRSPMVQQKIVNGAPLKLQVAVEGLPDEPFLAIYVAGSNMSDVEWPLMKRISVSILDSQGTARASYKFPTYDNGDYTHPSFIRPNTDLPPQGVCVLKDLAEVRGYYRRDHPDYLILSVSVEDLPLD